MFQIPHALLQLRQQYNAFIGDQKLSLKPYPKYKMRNEGWIEWTPFPSRKDIVVVSPPEMRADWHQQMGAQIPGGGAMGGGSGGSGGTGGAQAAAAVQAGLPAYTGGGPSFQQGAINIQGLLNPRQDELVGLDALTPPEKLGPSYSPDMTNWDGFAKYGSRCVRRGSAKLGDDADTLSLNSALRGLSIVNIPGDADQPEQLLVAFADNDIGQTRSSVQTLLHVLTTYPKWGRPVSLVDWPGPKLSLADQGSQVLRVTADYTNVFNNSNQKGMRQQSVVGLVIRYSTSWFPADIDGYDETNSTALLDWRGATSATTWDGSSKDNDSGTLTAVRYFVTAWAITREGISEPSTASKTLA